MTWFLPSIPPLSALPKPASLYQNYPALSHVMLSACLVQAYKIRRVQRRTWKLYVSQLDSSMARFAVMCGVGYKITCMSAFVCSTTDNKVTYLFDLYVSSVRTTWRSSLAWDFLIRTLLSPALSSSNKVYKRPSWRLGCTHHKSLQYGDENIVSLVTNTRHENSNTYSGHQGQSLPCYTKYTRSRQWHLKMSDENWLCYWANNQSFGLLTDWETHNHWI